MLHGTVCLKWIYLCEISRLEVCWGLNQSAGAALTEDHRRGGSWDVHSHTAPEAGSARSGCRQAWFLPRPLSWACRQAPPCVLTGLSLGTCSPGSFWISSSYAGSHEVGPSHCSDDHIKPPSPHAVTLWGVRSGLQHQAPLSPGFSRREHWSGLPCPPPGDRPDPGIEPPSLTSPALASRFLASRATWEANGQGIPLGQWKRSDTDSGDGRTALPVHWDTEVNSLKGWVSWPVNYMPQLKNNLLLTSERG